MIKLGSTGMSLNKKKFIEIKTPIPEKKPIIKITKRKELSILKNFDRPNY